MDNSRKLVVAALILRADGAVLISQRRADQVLPNYWEFPGGKVEQGEAPAAALARELDEELGVQATVGRIWDVMHYIYPDYEVVMLVYVCTLDPDRQPRPVQVQQVAWVSPEGLDEYEILPADAPLVERLRVDGVPI